MHRYAVAEHLASGQLVEILSGGDDSQHPIYLRYRNTKFTPPKIRHFIDFFVPKIAREY